MGALSLAVERRLAFMGPSVDQVRRCESTRTRTRYPPFIYVGKLATAQGPGLQPATGHTTTASGSPLAASFASGGGLGGS